MVADKFLARTASQIIDKDKQQHKDREDKSNVALFFGSPIDDFWEDDLPLDVTT